MGLWGVGGSSSTLPLRAFHSRLGVRCVVVGIAAIGLAIRLVIIARSNGGNDLAIYNYFSDLALHGFNPFAPPGHGLFPTSYSNSPPMEVALFTALLGIDDSRTILRVFFAVCDTTIILLLGLALRRTERWRIRLALFYALNPFVLFAWTYYAEDKTFLFLLIVLLIVALERRDEVAAWLATTGLTIFKFLGVFAVPVLALDTYRSHRRRALPLVGLWLLVLAISNLPWFPASLDAFSRRSARLGLDPPLHASPMLLLARVGLYAPWEVTLLSFAGAAGILVLFLRRRIGVGDAVIWSIFVGYAFLPDDNMDRLLLIALPVLLTVDLSGGQWLTLWLASCLTTLAGVVALQGVPDPLDGLRGPLHTLFASGEATVRYVLWMSLVPAIIVTFSAMQTLSGQRRAAISASRR